MNHLPIKNIKRIALGFGLLLGVLTSAQSQENRHEADLSGKPVYLYFRFDKAVVGLRIHGQCPYSPAIWKNAFRPQPDGTD